MPLFFLYTGLEATAGQWSYTLLAEGRGVAPAMAGAAVAAYWASLTAGRVVAGALTSRLSARVLLRGALLLAPAGGALVWAANGPALAVLGLVVLGAARCTRRPPSVKHAVARRHRAWGGGEPERVAPGALARRDRILW